MNLIRKYKKLGWWDLIERFNYDISNGPTKEIFFDYMDEFHMRKLESVSEGGSYKIKAPCLELVNSVEQRMKNDTSFAAESEFAELKKLANELIL